MWSPQVLNSYYLYYNSQILNLKLNDIFCKIVTIILGEIAQYNGYNQSIIFEFMWFLCKFGVTDRTTSFSRADYAIDTSLANDMLTLLQDDVCLVPSAASTVYLPLI